MPERQIRVLKKRIVSGCLITILLIALPIYVPLAGICLFFTILAGVAQMEFYGLMSMGGIPVFRILGLLAGCAMLVWSFIESSGVIPVNHCNVGSLALTASLIALFLRQFPQKNNSQPFSTMACTLMGILYVPYLISYLVRLSFFGSEGSWRSQIGSTGYLLLFLLIVVSKLTDMGAYFAGTALGRHKLIPRLSPAKTWEGLFGGLMVGIGASIVIAHAANWTFGSVPITLPTAAVLGGILAISATAGDLFESLLKRAAGAKDSGAILPGMGGILDVADSILFGAPIVYYWAIFAMR